jgi:hypothetical protein
MDGMAIHCAPRTCRPESLLRRIAQVQTLERGKVCLSRQWANGSYYNHQVWENGHNFTQYFPAILTFMLSTARAKASK